MNKNTYIEPVAIVTYFNTCDVITSSDPYGDDVDWDL